MLKHDLMDLQSHGDPLTIHNSMHHLSSKGENGFDSLSGTSFADFNHRLLHIGSDSVHAWEGEYAPLSHDAGIANQAVLDHSFPLSPPCSIFGGSLSSETSASGSPLFATISLASCLASSSSSLKNGSSNSSYNLATPSPFSIRKAEQSHNGDSQDHSDEAPMHFSLPPAFLCSSSSSFRTSCGGSSISKSPSCRPSRLGESMTIPRAALLRPASRVSKHKKPSKVCQHPSGCSRYSQGGTRFCIGHGGGKRCSMFGCNKSVQGSRSSLCIAHGGGKRCEADGCDHAARGATLYCVAHGGGARCQEFACQKSAQRPSDFCIAHGGGRRCAVPDCLTILRGNSTARLCPRHATVEPVLNRMGILASHANIKTVEPVSDNHQLM